MNIRLASTVAALALVLAACSPSDPAAGDAVDATVAGTADAPVGVADDTSADTVGSTAGADGPAPDAPPAAGPDPVIGFSGYRGAAFGSGADAVRAAHPGELAAVPPPAAPDDCHYLLPSATPGAGYPLAFMFEGGRFVRVDVATADLAAPGALSVGMSAAEVVAAFPDAESRPHKYVEGGQYLVVTPAGGGDARLVFEVDPQGIVTEWRAGLQPQVHYVEGCS